MNIQRISFSGVDETVDPEVLAVISKTFPFVEWGILMKPGIDELGGRLRYPLRKYRAKFAQVAKRNPEMKYSIHLCDGYARGFCKRGEDLWRMISVDGVEKRLYKYATRIQLNVAGSVVYPHAWKGLSEFFEKEDHKPVVIQMKDYQDSPYKYYNNMVKKSKVSPLFDPSMGLGITYKIVPSPDQSGTTGYCGGLGPDNIEEMIGKIGSKVRDWPIWLDMESGIRTENRFDVPKCLQVLAKTIHYTAA